MIDPRGAGPGSKNIIYDRGVLKTAHGFAKLDLTTTGLNSGEEVLNIFPYNELDGYSHLMAMTNSKIYENDKNNDTWTDKTQSGASFSGNIDTPYSNAVLAHTDAIALNDGAGASQYYHLVVSDGGNSDIQRWAGRYETDFATLLGGGGYHDGTTHRALQVASYQSRLILISPYNYESASKTWTISSQRVQYPQAGKLETWTGTGSGFVDLLDTGGFNVFSAPLGGQHIVYQTNGIWTLRHVGGSTVFDPYPYIPDLGLIAPHMLAVRNNIHYFMGTDYNIYAYNGGSVYKPIGDPIHADIENEISKSFEYRCWMALDERAERLWVFFVADGDSFIRYAYGMDTRTGAWQKRDFTEIFTDGAINGVTSVSLVGAQTYTTGDTYQNALDKVSTLSADKTDSGTAGDVTVRYGDVLGDTTITFSGDWSKLTIDAGGQDFSDGVTPGTFDAEFTENDILVVGDGSDQTNVSYGTHFYTVYDVSGNGFSVYPRGRSTGVDYGVADSSTNVPSFDATSTNWVIQDPSGMTYRQDLNEFLTGEKLHIGDASGFVYQFDETYTQQDGTDILSEHITPAYDLQLPDNHKRWSGVNVVARTRN
jgi:hypothetical protein